MRNVLVAVVAALVVVATPVAAQPYPAKTVRIVVPFAPGGTSDAVARLAAERLGAILGQSFVVDNRPGASGSIGATAVSKAEADGYTLLLMPGTHVLAHRLMKTPPFQQSDFTPISMLVFAPYVIFSAKNQPFTTLPQMVDYARANPEKLSIGNSEVTTRLAAESLAQAGKFKVTHVAYKGGGPITADVVGGHLALGVATPISVLSFIKDGRINALVVTSPKRLASLPDVPTVSEALGVPNFESQTWFALAGPAKLPPVVVERISGAVAKMLAEPEVRDRLRGMGVEPAEDASPRAMQAVMDGFVKRNEALLDAAGIKPE